MAIDLCSENSSMSPRISFSHDLCQSDIVPVEQRPFRSNSSGLNNSSIDFDFCVCESFDQYSCSADELFSNGKILPTEIKKKIEPTAKQVDQSLPPLPESSKQNKIMRDESGDEEIDEKQSSNNNNTSFWRFKRSSSFNCCSGYGRSLCPLPLLSRSNSTGSAPNVNQGPLSSNQKQNSKKQASVGQLKSSSLMSYQKPPLRKSYGSYGNGVRVNSVLNVPSGNRFGLGSIFSSGKDKNKKREIGSRKNGMVDAWMMGREAKGM